jgi:hypothetical protein
MMSWGWSRFTFMLYLAGSLALAIVPAIVLPGIAQAADSLGSSGVHPADFSRAAEPSLPPLASLLLWTTNLPAGFRLFAPLTGQLNASRGRALGVDLSRSGLLGHAWTRDWLSTSRRTEVLDMVADAGTRETAEGAVTVFDSTGLKAGMAPAPLTGTRFVDLGKTVRLDGIDYLMLKLSMARGPYLFALTVLTPVRSSASGYRLMSELAQAQSRKVPNDAPDTEGTDSQMGQADLAGSLMGGVLGIPLIYLCIVNWFAYALDPLRGERGHSRLRPALKMRTEANDVSKRARNNRRMAQLRLGVQIIGAIIAVIGVDPFLPYWYVFLFVGSIIMWAAGRYIQPGGFGRGRNQVALTGRRKFRVAALLSVASVLIILGFGLLVAAALANAQHYAIGSADAFQNLPPLGLFLVAGGAMCHRYARRLGSTEARRLMQRDKRPAVLYLRSFGDDGLKLRTATLGRSSFVERFTPSRFDAFEEVLARHLSVAGPVIALNAPGTNLPPLGAARESIDSADWRSAITTWMDSAALIVFVAPPEQLTPGLLWELETVLAHRHWAKTLIVVPPVDSETFERRWNAFLDAVGKLAPFTTQPLIHGRPPLVLAFRHNTWTVVTARRRNEWSYGAALHQAWAQFGTRQELGAEAQPGSPVVPAPRLTT